MHVASSFSIRVDSSILCYTESGIRQLCRISAGFSLENRYMGKEREAALVCASVATVRINVEAEQEACHLSHKWACEYQDLPQMVFGIFPGGQLVATALT